MGIRHLHSSMGNLSASRTQLSAVSEHASNNTGYYLIWEENKFIDRDLQTGTLVSRRVKAAIVK